MNPIYDFTGRVAFVTGAGSGMGLATARAFAEAGAAVTLADVDDPALPPNASCATPGTACWPRGATSPTNPSGVSAARRRRPPPCSGRAARAPGSSSARSSPADDLIPSLLAASDVLGTGWFGAVAAEVGPGETVAVVGDGAVGLLAVLAAKRLGAERIVAMSRHESRQKLAFDFGATDIVAERGDDGVARIKELTGGPGAVFDLTLPLDRAAGGYTAMDERTATKVLLTP